MAKSNAQRQREYRARAARRLEIIREIYRLVEKHGPEKPVGYQIRLLCEEGLR